MLEVWKKKAKQLQTRDRRLAAIIEKVGPPHLEFEKDGYRALVKAILSQQLAPAAANAILSKVSHAYPPFPRPTQLRSAPRLRACGVSERKAQTLIALSKKWSAKRWLDGWDELDDDELVEKLTEIKGIGLWTVQMYLIFSLGRCDVLASTDYGVRRGVKGLFFLESLPTPREVEEKVRHWAGGYSVACWYLWRALDQKLVS